MSQSHRYAAGQVWSYKARPGEEGSRVYIVKVDATNDPELPFVYHLFVDGIRIFNPNLAEGYQTVLPHSPVSIATLDASLVAPIPFDGPMPEIDEGYQNWRSGFETGDAGVFDIPIADIIGLLNEIMKSQAH